MVKKILVPVDGSEHAQKAVEFGANMAVQNDAAVHLLHVVSPTKIPEGFIELARSEHIEGPPINAYLQTVGSQIIEQAETLARGKGVKEIQKDVVEGDPAETILNYAQQGGFDMIVIGSRGLGGVKSLMLGSVSSKVCHAAEQTCVTVK